MSHSNSTSSLLRHLRTSICSSCLIYCSSAASASLHLQHHTTFILPYLHHLHIQPSPSCSIASQSSQHLIISSPPSQSIVVSTSSLHQDRIPYFPSSKYWCYPSINTYVSFCSTFKVDVLAVYHAGPYCYQKRTLHPVNDTGMYSYQSCFTAKAWKSTAAIRICIIRLFCGTLQPP